MLQLHLSDQIYNCLPKCVLETWRYILPPRALSVSDFQCSVGNGPNKLFCMFVYTEDGFQNMTLSTYGHSHSVTRIHSRESPKCSGMLSVGSMFHNNHFFLIFDVDDVGVLEAKIPSISCLHMSVSLFHISVLFSLSAYVFTDGYYAIHFVICCTPLRRKRHTGWHFFRFSSQFSILIILTKYCIHYIHDYILTLYFYFVHCTVSLTYHQFRVNINIGNREEPYRNSVII